VQAYALPTDLRQHPAVRRFAAANVRAWSEETPKSTSIAGGLDARRPTQHPMPLAHKGSRLLVGKYLTHEELFGRRSLPEDFRVELSRFPSDLLLHMCSALNILLFGWSPYLDKDLHDPARREALSGRASSNRTRPLCTTVSSSSAALGSQGSAETRPKRASPAHLVARHDAAVHDGERPARDC
jgi:hypothetical protein